MAYWRLATPAINYGFPLQYVNVRGSGFSILLKCGTDKTDKTDKIRADFFFGFITISKSAFSNFFSKKFSLTNFVFPLLKRKLRFSIKAKKQLRKFESGAV
jgi:hypothetical protein